MLHRRAVPPWRHLNYINAETWNCVVHISVQRFCNTQYERYRYNKSTLIHVNHRTLHLVIFEILQISEHKTEAQRFIFIESQLVEPLPRESSIGGKDSENI